MTSHPYIMFKISLLLFCVLSGLLFGSAACSKNEDSYCSRAQKECDEGKGIGCEGLAACWKSKGYNEKAAKYLTKARELLGSSCKKGDPYDCSRLWNLEKNEGNSEEAEKYKSEARKLYLAICENGEVGCIGGVSFERRLGDTGRAKHLSRLGCEKGNKGACEMLGRLHKEEGDLDEAKKYFKQACDLGLMDACLETKK